MEGISQLATNLITNFRKYFRESGRKKAVIGISGGVDSAVVAQIAVEALEPQNVFGLRLPHKTFSSEENLRDARQVCDFLKIDSREIDIASFCEPFFALDFATKKMTRGNIMARIRMILLYAAANNIDGLVLGTGNKTEILTGFFTKYGDGGVDIEVIGEVWKTEVFALAKYFGLPKNIYTKAPTAELFHGQTDERELGIDYPTLDLILQKMEQNALAKPFNPSELLVEKLVLNSIHKRGGVEAIRRE